MRGPTAELGLPAALPARAGHRAKPWTAVLGLVALACLCSAASLVYVMVHHFMVRYI